MWAPKGHGPPRVCAKKLGLCCLPLAGHAARVWVGGPARAHRVGTGWAPVPPAESKPSSRPGRRGRCGARCTLEIPSLIVTGI